jgi:hypothetical protein
MEGILGDKTSTSEDRTATGPACDTAASKDPRRAHARITDDIIFKRVCGLTLKNDSS